MLNKRQAYGKFLIFIPLHRKSKGINKITIRTNKWVYQNYKIED